MRAAVTDYCARIGADPLLVQGAGGNVSWKEGGTLWIKASGTWLAYAREQDIFVPVALTHLRDAIEHGDFDAAPRVSGDSHLRPSIETMLHALLEHNIVVHVHAVEILAHLVRADAEALIAEKMGTDTAWVMTAYHKPGPDLARALKMASSGSPEANVAFLQNHGVVVGGRDVAEADDTLRSAIERFRCQLRARSACTSDQMTVKAFAEAGYRPVPLPEVQQLALDPAYFDQLRKCWALYPDHVVFLGAVPHLFESFEAFCDATKRNGWRPELIFVKGAGVFEREALGEARYAYLQCYYDVMARQPDNAELVCLPDSSVNALLDWEAEKFRQARNATSNVTQKRRAPEPVRASP